MLISQLDVTPMVVEKMKPVDDRLDQKNRRVMNQKVEAHMQLISVSTISNLN